jgi:hypothetical protein
VLYTEYRGSGLQGDHEVHSNALKGRAHVEELVIEGNCTKMDLEELNCESVDSVVFLEDTITSLVRK